ncbi:hypothetical protein LS70_009485 [Helicobacter sp. MIT 11-5569]|uniref:hypothetical protein n=1 Tax=Helicobacter sp. MIT 11-5569 TaxID=1548151 RepID=UPI00051FF1FE|nr:hypothetical protein [Helicobacter sp. MIT 11-5569]TLD80014.1 hypothetical protein LS70_009485 [Helicobacter sp. MIT 11-5569]
MAKFDEGLSPEEAENFMIELKNLNGLNYMVLTQINLMILEKSYNKKLQNLIIKSIMSSLLRKS